MINENSIKEMQNSGHKSSCSWVFVLDLKKSQVLMPRSLIVSVHRK